MSETTWKLVPGEDTLEQNEAGRRHHVYDSSSEVERIYSAMVKTAPKPAPGLYEVRDDGSVRLIETDVAKALEACMQDTLFYAEQVCEPGSQGRAEGWQRIEQARAVLRALTGDGR